MARIAYALLLGCSLLSATFGQETKEKLEPAWLEMTAALKPAEQAKAIHEKLKDFNFLRPASVTFKAEGDKIVEFGFNGGGIEDIRPLVVLKHVRKLNISGSAPQSETDKERVKEISVVKDMPLIEMYMAWSKVTDLSPL